MKVRDLTTGSILKVFQHYWVDAGDGCSPGSRMECLGLDNEAIVLDPGEYELVQESDDK